MSFVAGIQVFGILLALYLSGWWLLARPRACGRGDLRAGDGERLVLARYTPAGWRGRIYAIRFFLIFTMAGPAAWASASSTIRADSIRARRRRPDRGLRRAEHLCDQRAGHRRGKQRRAASLRRRRWCSRRSDRPLRVAFIPQGQRRKPLSRFHLHAQIRLHGSCGDDMRLSCLFGSCRFPAREPLRRTRSGPRRRAEPPAPAAAATKAARRPRASRPPDARPSMRRDETAAAVTAVPAAALRHGPEEAHGAQARRAARGSRGWSGPQGTAQGGRSSKRTSAACGGAGPAGPRRLPGCTLRHRGRQGRSRRGARPHFTIAATPHSAKGDMTRRSPTIDEAIKLDPKNAALSQSRQRPQRQGRRRTRRSRTSARRSKPIHVMRPAYFNRANAFAARGASIRAIADYGRAQVQPAQHQCLYRARRAALASGAAAKARADCAQAGRLERKNRLYGAVAGHCGPAREAEGRADGRRQGCST